MSYAEEVMYDNYDYGYDFGGFSPYDVSQDIGYGFGAPPPPPPPPPGMHPGFHPLHHMMHHPGHHPMHHPGHHPMMPWQHSPHNPASTASRTLLLDPNRDSHVKVERYSFAFSPELPFTLGTVNSAASFSMTQNPSTSIKPQRVVANAPIPGFVQLSTLQVANVNVFVGSVEDAYTYSAGAMGVMLDLPRLDPQNRATAAGSYTGALPAGYTAGFQYLFILTLQGPSTLAGGWDQ
jgi:hypothetical protein